MSALAVVEELERRDVAAAVALAEVEELRAAAEGIRARAGDLAAFDAALPDERRRRAEAIGRAETALAEAEAERAHAEQELERAKREQERAVASRRAADARDAARQAAAEVERTRAAAEQLEREAEEADAAGRELEQEAGETAAQVAAHSRIAADAAAPPAAGLDGVAAWGARVRPALLLLSAALAAEREAIVREANELGSAVLGEALGATSVAGVREYVARALAPPRA